MGKGTNTIGSELLDEGRLLDVCCHFCVMYGGALKICLRNLLNMVRALEAE
jgi:hypothetical protein